ncbi:MAG: EVE domain-containing protein, partial [Thaumarchaeota archaeon]|nr:EVE domain-containing protein [Nitrososphaerota archaeon]
MVTKRQVYSLHRNCREYSRRNLQQMQRGDMIMLYVTKPISGIVGIFKATSEAYTE